MHERQFITSGDAEAFVKTIRPDVQDIKLIMHGYDNVIAIVDEKLVFRFPRNEVAVNRQHFEAQLLRHLHGKISLPIPEILEVHRAPDYLVTNRIPGAHISLTALRELPAEYSRIYAHDIAQFMKELNAAVSPHQVTETRAVNHMTGESDELWPDTLKRVLQEASFPDKAWLEEVAHHQYEQWEQLCAHSNLPIIVVHDDLHVGNLLFKDSRISGILDFGDAAIGTAAQEMRQLFRINEDILRTTIYEYAQLTGIHISEEEVATWAITTELASYCERLVKGDINHPSFIRTQATMKRWLPAYSSNF
jgi:aminoglycoside phosphotransferase (APT) family kinase protein